jgi:SagB-type dehydrogenase family enzyme
VPVAVKNKSRRAAPSTLSARVSSHVKLESDATGQVVASFHGRVVSLGRFSTDLAARLEDLRIGLPLPTYTSRRRQIEKELHLLIRRLAMHGLLEYCLQRSENDSDQLIIEPQFANYWPATPPLDNADVLVLSRFAYIRRRGKDLVLESPRAGALFKICDPKIATIVFALSTPQSLKRLRQQDGFPGVELLSLLLDCQILFKIQPETRNGLRQVEGDYNLVFWDFHDLLFHARSTEGRHANPLGAVYPHIGVAPALPAVRPLWPGKKINLRKFTGARSGVSSLTRLLQQRHSIRNFDDTRPVSLEELSRFLENTARVLSKWTTGIEGGPSLTYTVRPYPSAGAAYELELYLAVNKCDGLGRGFYYYDPGGHALVPLGARTPELEALLARAQFAMGAPASPQILITIAARFGRISWKYSSLAYALILKDVGVLTQTFYLMATDMGLGGCAVGITNIDLFAKMTGIEFHIEGPVGQFALGRPSKSSSPTLRGM